MGLETAVGFRLNGLGASLDTTRIQDRPVEVVIQGTGLWVKRAIQPDMRLLHDELKSRVPTSRGLYVSYIGLEQNPVLDIDHTFETYYCRDDSEAIEEVRDRSFDLVIIATPADAHIDNVRRWLHHDSTPKAILVEKPFSDELYELDALAKEIAILKSEGTRIPPILGIDHYNLYFAEHVEQLAAIDEFIPDLRSVVFSMLETRPIEHDRLRSVRSGMSFEMASHFFGILSIFANLATSKDLTVHYSARHDFDPYAELQNRRYFAETAIELSLKVRLWNENRNIFAYSRIGKASAIDAKFVEFQGDSDRVVRLDFSSSASGHDGYPYGGALFATKEPRGDGVFVDPFEPETYFRAFSTVPGAADPSRPWKRHGRLVDALVTGDFRPYDFLLTIGESRTILLLLEEIRESVVNLPEHEPGQQQWKGSWPEDPMSRSTKGGKI